MDSKSDDSIQVCIRVRPGQQDHSILEFTQNQIHLDRNHFGFDHIFPPTSTQNDVFQLVGTKMISHTLDGYNGCVFVYGQTGSGKTYTMMGDNNGLMQNSFYQLFKEIQAMKNSECTTTCSYYEIYNEQIIDLLDIKKDKEKKMMIRQDMKKGVFVENMTEEAVYSSQKLLECLAVGMRNRHVGETMMNRQSSRSHSIFTINFSIRSEVNGNKVLKTPKMHFVDLAGSERQKMTAASGDRLKQAGNINKSLTTLGMVINALACEKNRSHIPYRDSKLTSLLRDSLGGNSKTFLIATVSRNVLCFQETLSTLNFANRAKMVKVKALINEQSLSTNIQTFKQQIRRLKAQIIRLKTQKRTPNPSQIRYIHQNHQQNIQKVQNYDNQFKQINQKISVISDHLIKNPVSPSFDLLMEQIQNLKSSSINKISRNNSTKTSQMKDEAQELCEQEIEQQGGEGIEEDALIQYLSCNNSLLEKIHKKIDEYVELKQQLRNMAYQNTMTIADLKTPSKFQRDQYEEKIKMKQAELQSLNSEIRTLHTLLSEKDIAIQQLRSQSLHRNGKIEERDEQIQAFIKDQTQMRRQIGQLKNLLKQTNQQVQKVNKKYIQAQNQSKQNKQLYLYIEQNYETERTLRRKVEDNLLQKIDELDRMEKIFTQRFEEKKQYFEETEERLKDQISVLTQTVEFNENLLADFRQKLVNQEQLNEQNAKTIQKLTEYTVQLKNQIIRLEDLSKKLKLKIEQLENQMEINAKYNEDVRNQLDSQISSLKTELEILNEEKNQEIQNKNQLIGLLKQQNENLISLVNEKSSQISQMQQKFSQKLNKKDQQLIKLQNQSLQTFQTLQGTIHRQQETIQLAKNENTILQQQIIQRKQAIQKMQTQITNIQTQYTQRIEKMMKQHNEKLMGTKKIQIENQQLKKAHKDLLRENYKIKAKYGNNENKTQQQLISKVNYYEQKFRLMSMEYQKALQAVKKMKQKQISQAKKISNLQQNQKVLKINYQNSGQNDSITEQLKKQNLELKKQLQTYKSIKKASLSKICKNTQKQKIQPTQKEQQIHTKILTLIKKLDPSKQNISNSKNLEQLLNKWQQLQAQSNMKIDAIQRGIKKQQKMRTQNKLIMKQNIYLKQQLTQMEKQILEMGGRPRKIVKKSPTEELCVDVQ